MGLSTFGHTAPESFKQGMISVKAESVVMWKCSSYGNKTCNFNDDSESLRRQLTAVGAPAFGNDDCNKYADCHKCITATEGNVKCGWCLGDTLNYKGIGKTSYKCGGFQAGKPYNFTCGIDFRTTDCKGYACDLGTKKCSISDDGQFPDLPSCADNCNKVVPYAKCNG